MTTTPTSVVSMRAVRERDRLGQVAIVCTHADCCDGPHGSRVVGVEIQSLAAARANQHRALHGEPPATPGRTR